MESILGAAIVALAYFIFRSLKPKDGVVHPLVRRDSIGNAIVLAIVAAVSIGSALLVNGVVKYF